MTGMLLFFFSFFFLMIRPPPRSTQQGTLFPYTTLFRSSMSGGRADCPPRRVAYGTDGRSEEHTSELQSRLVISYAVFCLKKKKTDKRIASTFTPRSARSSRRRKTSGQLTVFFLMIRRPPRSTQQGTLFPYTTLFRSIHIVAVDVVAPAVIREPRNGVRSEEHTSELQSRLVISYAVFCLKKKKGNCVLRLVGWYSCRVVAVAY